MVLTATFLLFAGVGGVKRVKNSHRHLPVTQLLSRASYPGLPEFRFPAFMQRSRLSAVRARGGPAAERQGGHNEQTARAMHSATSRKLLLTFLWNSDLKVVMSKDHNTSQQTRVPTTEKINRDLSWFFLKTS